MDGAARPSIWWKERQSAVVARFRCGAHGLLPRRNTAFTFQRSAVAAKSKELDAVDPRSVFAHQRANADVHRRPRPSRTRSVDFGLRPPVVAASPRSQCAEAGRRWRGPTRQVDGFPVTNGLSPGSKSVARKGRDIRAAAACRRRDCSVEFGRHGRLARSVGAAFWVYNGWSGQPLWPALTIERWHHKAFLGRDVFVEVDTKDLLPARPSLRDYQVKRAQVSGGSQTTEAGRRRWLI